MNDTKPVASQQDRDLLADVGLPATVVEHEHADDQLLPSSVESEAT